MRRATTAEILERRQQPYSGLGKRRISPVAPPWPAPKWVAVKVLSETKAIGCVIGPFHTEKDALIYAGKAGQYNLGYETWVVRELQRPNKL